MATDLDRIRHALSFVPPDDRDTWVRMAMAVKSMVGEDGFPECDAWSQGADSYKAADAILKLRKVKGGVSICIKKRIPVAGGLGGGSSDAAAVLKGMNRLFRLRLSDRTLLSTAKELGADVPFFMLDAAFASGKGRGDELKVIRSKSLFWHLIIKAGSKVDTKDIYEAFDSEAARGPKCLLMPTTSMLMAVDFSSGISVCMWWS